MKQVSMACWGGEEMFVLELGRMQGVSRSNELPGLLEQKDFLVLMSG